MGSSKVILLTLTRDSYPKMYTTQLVWNAERDMFAYIH